MATVPVAAVEPGGIVHPGMRAAGSWTWIGTPTTGDFHPPGAMRPPLSCRIRTPLAKTIAAGNFRQLWKNTPP